MTATRESCCCPTFCVALVGPWICILGAVFVDQVVVQELTDFIWIGGHPYDDMKIRKVARVLAALGKGIGELEEFYSQVGSRRPAKDPQRFFPFVREYVVEGRTVRISYKAYLVPKGPDSHMKPIFMATMEDGSGSNQKVVVKFVQIYNARGHRAVARAGLAPKLHYCSGEDENAEYLGGLVMVVMDYVGDGKTAHEQYRGTALPEMVYTQLERAIRVLHGEEIVFGDLRGPNILVHEGGGVKLVDFDWCGEHGIGRYPVSLNDEKKGTSAIKWHPEVKRGGLMMKEHDVFRLECLKFKV
jgi:hypothetical protein